MMTEDILTRTATTTPAAGKLMYNNTLALLRT